MAEQLIQAALGFLARDARPVGFQEAEALIKVRDWLAAMLPALSQANGVDKSATSSDRATEA